MELSTVHHPQRYRMQQGAKNLPRRFFTHIRIWFERSRQRRALLRLDSYMLKDIGISRCDAEREAAKWFFQE